MLEDKNPQLTPISAYGEFGLIKHLTERFSFENSSTEVSIGDDAAVINPEGKKSSDHHRCFGRRSSF